MLLKIMFMSLSLMTPTLSIAAAGCPCCGDSPLLLIH
jgi:hypothetical protein